MRIALIGDIHLYSLKPKLRHLLGKRLIGQSNLWLNRRFRFNHDMLEPVVERVQAIEPDMVLLTGDVTTTSLDDEFSDIVHYLKPLSEKLPLMLVPGNHDRYTFKAARKRRPETLLKGLLPDAFPHHSRITERWHLLGLDSARPQLMLSRGALGAGQIAATREILAGLTADDGLIVLCHYPAITPPGTPRSWAHDLAEADLLRDLLEACPARKLFLHGHIHRPWHWESDTGSAEADLTCINAGAPCMISSHYPLGQGFWEIDLPDNPADPLNLTHHVPAPDGHYGTHGSRRQRASEPIWHARHVV